MENFNFDFNFNFIEKFFGKSKSKTHEEFNIFINKIFVNYLKNTDLFTNFITDFDNYKLNKTIDKNYCNECEKLYILTNDIFENYIRKIKIPYDISIYSEGKDDTPKKYKNKVLYFFNIDDLKKILEKENLDKSSEDSRSLVKKKILCKIISVTFIKIYIIIKAIYETFNIYNIPYNSNNISNIDSPDTLDTLDTLDTPDTPDNTIDNPQIDQLSETQIGGKGFLDKFNPFNLFNKKKSQNEASQEPGQNEGSQDEGSQNEASQELQEPGQNEGSQDEGSQDIQMSDESNVIKNKATVKENTTDNLFYSIFIILFKNNIFIKSKNYTEKGLKDLTDTLDISIFTENIGEFIKYLCKYKFENIVSTIQDKSIIFSKDNFNFLKFKSDDEKSINKYLSEADEKYEAKYNNQIKGIEDELETLINNKLLRKLNNQCNLFENKSIKFDKNLLDKNGKFIKEIKYNLTVLIENYFKNRQNMYNKVIKNIFNLNKETGEIINIKPTLSYKKIVLLTERTKKLILTMHLEYLKPLKKIIELLNSKFKEIEKLDGFLLDSNTELSQEEPAPVPEEPAPEEVTPQSEEPAPVPEEPAPQSEEAVATEPAPMPEEPLAEAVATEPPREPATEEPVTAEPLPISEEPATAEPAPPIAVPLEPTIEPVKNMGGKSKSSKSSRKSKSKSSKKSRAKSRKKL